MRMEAEYVKRYAAMPSTPATALNPLATLKANDESWGWNVGALLNISPATKVGVSYRSKVKQKLDGTLTVAGVTSFAAKADLDLPDMAILSLTHKLNSQWELLGDVSWTGWSSVPKVDIVRKADGAVVQTLGTAFKDSWRVAVGTNYQLNDALKLKFGIAYDQTPVPDAAHRLVSLPDNDRTWFSVGGQWKPNKDSALDLGVSYLMVKNTDINAVSAASGTTVRGTYDSNVWIVGAQYSMAF
jgi:long-chain fatty acid transport protein